MRFFQTLPNQVLIANQVLFPKFQFSGDDTFDKYFDGDLLAKGLRSKGMQSCRQEWPRI